MMCRQERFQTAQGEASQPPARKPYTKPEIILQLALETRAGSPLSLPDPFDPFGLDAEK